MAKGKPEDFGSTFNDMRVELEGKIEKAVDKIWDHLRWFLGILIVITLAALGFLWSNISKIDEKMQSTLTDIGIIKSQYNLLEAESISPKKQAKTLTPPLK